MPTEITASIMIGPVAVNSTHGQSSLTPMGQWFCPSHVMVLMEGSRATWVVQECPSLGQPTPAHRIHPASPEHLLAAAMLGYLALVKPDVVQSSESLGGAVALASGSRTLHVSPLDPDLAAKVFAACNGHIYGAVTTLPGSTITDDQLQIATANGLLVAVAGRTAARAGVEL